MPNNFLRELWITVPKDHFTPHITARYDASLCRGVLNDIVDDERRQQVFHSFARALRPGGTLIVDVRNWQTTAERKGRNPVFEKSVETSRGKLTFRSVTQVEPGQQQRLSVTERHTVSSLYNESIATYDFAMRCWTQQELHHHLTNAGFNSIVFFGDYDLRTTIGTSDRLVSMASLSS